MNDTSLVINPVPGNKADEAVVAYMEQRKLALLPPGWTESYTMVRAKHDCGVLVLFPPDHDPLVRTLIACYAESPVYSVEIIFTHAWAESDPDEGPPSTGGFQLEFFRKDLGVPSDLETEAIARLFSGAYFGTSDMGGITGSRFFNGDLDTSQQMRK